MRGLPSDSPLAASEAPLHRSTLRRTADGCAVLLAGFALADLAGGLPFSALCAAAGVPFALASGLAARREPMPRWAPLPLILSLPALLFCLLFLCNETHGAALMWLGAIPPLAFLCLTPQGALALCGGAFAISAAALLSAEHLLPPAYALRLATAFWLAVGIGWIYRTERARAQARLAAARAEAEHARAEITRLTGMLSVCGWCHRHMRDDVGQWQPMERFLQDRAPVVISHGLCPACERRMARDLPER